MKLLEQSASRRVIIQGGAVAALAWLSRPFLKSASAQELANISALSVSRVPSDPDDPAWQQTQAANVPLNPQNMVLPRLNEAGAKVIAVRAFYDTDRVAFLLEWRDAHRDVDLGTVLQYRDAVAVQFPEEPASTPPSFTMGEKGRPVVIYHWKSDWQFSRLHDVDESYPNMVGDLYPFSGAEAGRIPEATDYLTKGRKEYLTAAAAGNALADPTIQEKIGPVQKMRAEGFGTIEPDATQDAKGMGTFRDGTWKIVITVPRKQAKFTFEEGSLVPLAFAVWDGSRNERNGRKAFSIWNSVRIGASAAEGGGILVPLLGSVAGVVVAAVALILGLRMWRGRGAQKR